MQDIQRIGEAPIRETAVGHQLERQPTAASTTAPDSKHRHPLHRHRLQRSSDQSIGPTDFDSQLHRTSTSQDAFAATRRNTVYNQAVQPRRIAEMSPPQVSGKDPIRESVAQRSIAEAEGKGKRSLLDRIRHRNKGVMPPDSLKNLSAISLAGSASSTASLAATNTVPPRAFRKGSVTEDRPLVPQTQPQRGGVTGSLQRKEHSRLPFKSKRGFSTELNLGPLPRIVQPNDNLFDLDTDLTHMEGIVNRNQPLGTPTGGAQFFQNWAPGEEIQKADDPNGVWDAPDSWAVKRTAAEAALEDQMVHSESEDSGRNYRIRIFRPDTTFATLSVALNTTAAEIVSNLAKKSVLQDDIDSYQIVMRRNGVSRQLEPGERPVLIQKRLLEQAGYNDSDNIEDLGKEDHSYLCRFNFLPSKMSGYSSLDRDPGFNKAQKFSNVDLQGRNLITIPITLYQKSGEILVLNLSRNISLDVPKDFVQACINLREIKYTGNECLRLSPAFSLAHKLTVLDISNNRLESLDSAELHKLECLASLKLSNNKLTSLPETFNQLKALRSLNISSNSFTEMPFAITEIPSIVDLDISFNSLTSLQGLGRLENLERLWCTNNRLVGTKGGSGVLNLKTLREIDCRFNRIENLDFLSGLPRLEHLFAGHNATSTFESSFLNIRTLYLDHNPLTNFSLLAPTPTLSTLSLASGKLTQLPEDVFAKMPGLTKLILNKNHFVTLTPGFGRLQKLDHLSIAKNSLSTLPPEIGRLSELRFLDVRENNINLLPSELWLCRKLETLNLSSNVLDAFPRMILSSGSIAGLEPITTTGLPPVPMISPTIEEGDQLAEFAARRMSVASGYLSTASSPSSTHRKGSIASLYAVGRKPSTLTRVPTEGFPAPLTRKDSVPVVNRAATTFIGSLRNLFLADNRLSDDVFDQLVPLQELRILNLSYNELYDIPPRTIRRWQYLSELYLSGNDLTSLPAEDFEDASALRVLHINNNKFQVLPAELGKVQKLAVLDVSSNSLKYNVNNWPYDWNWNWNRNLKYLNLSGNKRLEIKPTANYGSGREEKNLTDFSALTNLRVLGLMDVTLMIPSVPDQSDDRRVRTSGSNIGMMAYGIADSLGRNEHLSTIDLVIPRLEGHDDETLIGLFDGVPMSNGGSKIAKYLSDNFEAQFKAELKRKQAGETVGDALRRTYLALNKELATLAHQSVEAKERRTSQLTHRGSLTSLAMLNEDDLASGAVATVMYLHGMDLFVSNVGDAQALLIKSEGGYRIVTEKHDPAETKERHRIREAGSYVSRQGKLNDAVDLSRAFGFTHMMPAIIAAPHVAHIPLQESDEMILLASRDLWDYLSPDFAVDLARSERGDLMRAAQKLRDLAIAFGAPGKLVVMILGVGDLRKRERARLRTHSMSMGPSGQPDDYLASRRAKRGRETALDSKLARLDQEVDAPVGEVSLVFTDIKNSTLLWETCPIAMRSAIKMHNEVMRRQLRLIGGYEVKTEGDAFMVAFPTVTSALLWCFTCQSQLLEVQWPQEILNSTSGQEVTDPEGNVLFRGLSVRMGIHWGQPVCETDPVTRRMDYFGPVVNRAARISAVADGGQITVSSDFIAEVQRLLETHIETDRANSAGSEEQMSEDATTMAIRRELRSLSSHGFEVKDLGERKLKGLENPEYIYLMYPHSLSGRLVIQQQRAEAEKASIDGAGAKTRDSQLSFDVDNVWNLWAVSLRLEMLCSTLEGSGASELKAPETALLERTRERGGEVTDRFIVNFVEHQVSRIEVCLHF